MGRYRAMFRRYPDVVTAEQMREMLGVGTRTAYRLLRENKIQSVRMGRIYRIPKISVIDFLCHNENEKT